MPSSPTTEEIADWDRWFAVEMNNQAWAHAENPGRTTAEAEEMLHSAHAAALHWQRVGTELNRARADMLLGLAHALSGSGELAMVYARRSFDYLTSHQCPDWELAFTHAVLAFAAHADDQRALHSEHYAKAKELGLAIAEDVEQEIFLRTFAQVPAPVP